MGVRRLLASVAVLAGCSSGSNLPVPPAPDASSGAEAGASADGGGAFSPGIDADIPGCTGLQCFVNTHCAVGSQTTLTGTAYDPAGVTPLYQAIVYVPTDAQPSLPLITPGTATSSCAESCGITSIGDYVAATLTDVAGQFTLSGVPTGSGVPLVFEIGKWRRLVRVDTADCAKTTVDASLSRLPRNQSEGDIPQMALVTGQCDELGCFMSNLGLDSSEFTGPSGGGRLHVYKGAGPGPDLEGGGPGPAGDCSQADAGCPLWSSTASLSAYDIVLLGCECGAHDETKPAAAIQAMHDWLGAGGRVLATHYQDTWFKSGPTDFQGIASWLPAELNGPTPGPFVVPASEGPVLQEFTAWLTQAGELDPDGGIRLPSADVSTSVTSTGDGGVIWIADETTGDPKVLAFATPIGGVLPEAGVEAEAQYCGRAMFTDVHAGGGGSPSTAPVPASCTGPSSSVEQRALEYLFFNLSGECAPVPEACGCPPPPPPPQPPPPPPPED
jgi:hypothetical protein